MEQTNEINENKTIKRIAFSGDINKLKKNICIFFNLENDFNKNRNKIFGYNNNYAVGEIPKFFFNEEKIEKYKQQINNVIVCNIYECTRYLVNTHPEYFNLSEVMYFLEKPYKYINEILFCILCEYHDL